MDLGEYFRFFLALGFVLVLIAGLAALVRRSGFGDRLAMTPSSAGERRLALVEVRPLDTKHKLVLLRRDDREHLILLGAAGDLLIEGGIAAPPGKPAETTEAKPGTSSMGGMSGMGGMVGRLTGRLRGPSS